MYPHVASCSSVETMHTNESSESDGYWWALLPAFALFSFLLHFVWEMLQIPLYAGMAEARHLDATLLCLQATFGDVVIALCAYIVVAASARAWHWRPTSARMATYLIVGLVITVVMEMLNVHVWKRWSFGPAMPMVFGMSVSPLLQWIIIPPLALWLTRRHVRGART